MIEDWQTVPFVSLKVVDVEERCPIDHPDEAIYSVFMGTHGYCDCSDEPRRSYNKFRLGDCPEPPKTKRSYNCF